MNVFLMSWSAVALAGDAGSTHELLAVAQGDFDGSGTLDQANLYGLDDELIVEVTLGYTNGKPFGAKSGATVAFLATKGGDGLQITDDLGQTYVVSAGDHADVMATAVRGAGDSQSDVSVVTSRLAVDEPTLVVGLTIHACKWDRDYPCLDACAEYCLVVHTNVHVCGTLPDGKPKYCVSFSCESWTQDHCE